MKHNPIRRRTGTYISKRRRDSDESSEDEEDTYEEYEIDAVVPSKKNGTSSPSSNEVDQSKVFKTSILEIIEGSKGINERPSMR